MLMYSLIEYSNNYSKTSGGLFEYKGKPAVDNTGSVVDFTNDNSTHSFYFTGKATG